MKKLIIITFILISTCISAFAQQATDVIITKKAEKIVCKVTEVSTSEVKYKKADMLEGPVFSLPKSDISSIMWSNGNVEVFESEVNNAAQYNNFNQNSASRMSQSQQYYNSIGVSVEDQLAAAQKTRKTGSSICLSGLCLDLIGYLLMSTSSVDVSEYGTVSYGSGYYIGYAACISGGILALSGGITWAVGVSQVNSILREHPNLNTYASSISLSKGKNYDLALGVGGNRVGLQLKF